MALIRDVTYSLEETSNQWIVNGIVYLETSLHSSATIDGEIIVNLQTDLNQNVTFTKIVTIEKTDGTGEFFEEFQLTIDKSKVKLWWPNGYGHQSLYALSAKWQSGAKDVNTNEIRQIPLEYAISEKIVFIGFRTIELVEEELGMI